VKACVDVGYHDKRVVAACVGFERWTDTEPAFEAVVRSPAPAAAYERGQFWRRELPYLLEVLRGRALSLVVIDGYVWLDEHKPGLGARLFEALERRAAVVGVAKRPFRGATDMARVLRGRSNVPLYVSAAGVPLEEAAAAIAQMAGPFRIPTLLRRVDRLSRDP
jgi:deoxyribonuclease V